MHFIRSYASTSRRVVRHITHAIARMFPFVYRERRTSESRRELFSKAYQSRVWGSSESHSGTGSELRATVSVRRNLPSLLEKLEVASMLDAPCGDWNWMSQVELPVEKYIGMDIVSSVVEQNAQRFGNDTCSFQEGDITQDELPRVDFVLCRDCLVHLSNEDILSAIRNFKRSGIQYLLTNNYPEVRKNLDQFSGLAWRRINLFLPPFGFPQPLETIDDGEEVAPGNMCLWRLDDIKIDAE